MHVITLLAFQDELEKLGSNAAELAGLGILAAPSLGHMAGKDFSEKNKARAEVAGLGVLAAPAALAVGKKAVSKGKGLLRALSVAKHASKKKEAAPSMSAMMNMHRLADSAKAMKNVAKPAAAAAVKLPNQAAQAARASSLANHTAQGGHAWNPAAQAKRAIPL